jgi:hypothetical protein
MSYWYGYRVVELDSSNPGTKCISDPFQTYEDAKRDKQKNRASDMQHTAIFEAENKQQAMVQLEKETFSKL